MKHLIVSIILAFVSLVASPVMKAQTESHYTDQEFEQAVELIKKYESLNSAKHWPYVGYGHRVQPGEKFRKGVALTESQADELLRKDLKKLVDYYSKFGKDSLILGVLAYNVGPGNVNKSSIMQLLKSGNRNIRDAFTSMCKYRGKEHKQIKKRRIEEFAALFKN